MKITIDDKVIEALPGDTVMSAAKRADVFIPGLCHDDATGGGNNCRLCMVEQVEKGREKLIAACALPVKDGLVFSTRSQRVARIRKTLLELLYLQAKDNPTILDLMEKCGVVPPTSLPEKEKGKNGIDGCILCSRCVNACAHLGAAAISTIGRGVIKEVNTPYGKEAEVCIGCGACAQACPLDTIPMTDTEEGRTIWNREFHWIRCESCDAIISTKEQYQASLKKLREKGAPLPEHILCPDCKRRYMADVFSASLGESES